MTARSAVVGDVCTFVGRGTPTRSVARYYGGSITWVTPKDMKTWEIRGAQVNITRAGLENSATRLVPPHSVLVVVRSGVLKHTVPVAINKVPVAINQDMKALLCSEQADPDYMARFLKARRARAAERLRRVQSGVRISRQRRADRDRIATFIATAIATGRKPAGTAKMTQFAFLQSEWPAVLRSTAVAA